MVLLKWLGGLVGVIVLAVSLFFFYMRFHDGPMEIVAGGMFQSGEVVDTPVTDWSHIKDLATLQMQTIEPPRSRTTWLAVVDGKLYIPSGYMNTEYGKLWKQWPIHAEKDGRALIRIDGRIYPRQLVRIDQNNPNLQGIFEELDRKYETGLGSVEAVATGSLWLFELAPGAWPVSPGKS